MKKLFTIVGREIRDMLPALTFFLVTFHMIALTNAVLMKEHGMTTTRASIATVAALIVTKAILIVDTFPWARLFARRTLYNVLWRTLLFGVVTIFIRVVEELIHGLLARTSLRVTTSELLAGISWSHFWVVQMWLFSLLFAYCLGTEVVRRVGAAQVKAMLLDPTEPLSRSGPVRPKVPS